MKISRHSGGFFGNGRGWIPAVDDRIVVPFIITLATT
jgi:hypothetical protein